MEFGKFVLPSTFSYVGRNGLALRYLLKQQAPPKKILEAGSGCIEPLVFSQILPPDSEIYAVDSNNEIIKILDRLIHNEEIELGSLATLVCNINNDNTKRSNTDLTDLELIDIGLNELELAGVNSSLLYSNGFLKKPLTGAKIYPINKNIFDFANGNRGEFDLAFAGFLFLNLEKMLERGDLIKYAKVMLDSLRPSGVLGVTTTPVSLYGPYGNPTIFLEAGAEIKDVILDNLVSLEISNSKRLVGGYLIKFVNGSEKSKEDDLDDIRLKVYNHLTIPNLRISESTENASTLFERDDGRILLAAKSISYQRLKVWSVDKEEILPYIPGKRTLLGLL